MARWMRRKSNRRKPKEIWNQAHLSSIDSERFRADNAIVWQTREFGLQSYLISFLYALSIDRASVATKSLEDGLFGVEFFELMGQRVSRDLIDSIIEINFLERQLNISSSKEFTILDIGAGYGRLAKRVSDTYKNSTYFCIDKFKEMSDLSKKYLAKEIRSNRVCILSPGELENGKTNFRFDLALNVHSFSEMSIAEVDKWLNLLFVLEVRYLFIVPNPLALALNDGTEFSSLVERNGYRLIAQEPKYGCGEVAKFALYPANYYLFERDGKLRGSRNHLIGTHGAVPESHNS